MTSSSSAGQNGLYDHDHEAAQSVASFIAATAAADAQATVPATEAAVAVAVVAAAARRVSDGRASVGSAPAPESAPAVAPEPSAQEPSPSNPANESASFASIPDSGLVNAAAAAAAASADTAPPPLPPSAVAAAAAAVSSASVSAPAQEPAPASAPPAIEQTPADVVSPATIANRPSTPPPNPPNKSNLADTAHEPPVTPTAHTANTMNSSNAEDVPMPDAPDANASAPTAGAPAHQAGPLQTQQGPQHAVQMPATEHYQPSTPYTPALNHHAYMMMALASMSAAPPAMSPPPTVTPSQVTLPNLLGEAFHGLAPANSLRQAGPDMGLESFARIEFADSVFQMTTYAVIIGRDQRALEQARRDEKRSEEHRRRAEENASKGLPPPSPILPDRHKFSKSYVSEEGGMLGPESYSEENGRPAKRRKTSTADSSEHDNNNSQENIISNRQYVSHTPGAAAVDLASLRPSPWHVPFVGIHSPGPNIASKTKAISREHLKIAYNQKECVFEAIPLHKNGFFCEDVHYKSEKVVLRCGDRLQIKDIDFRFIINGVERGRTGAEEYQEEDVTKKRHAQGGKTMSFDFEQSHGVGQIQDTSDELSDIDSPAELSDLGGEEDDNDDDDDDDDEEGDEADAADEEAEGDTLEPSIEEDAEVKNETEPNPDLMMPQIPKKRGPGRPPKNGIMSKREQRLLKKQQQEMAKKTLPQAPPVEPPIKRKVGRPRKHPLPENAGDRPEKRKYKPRKPKNEDGAEGSDAERRAREKKEKKARPKSPPLELKIEDYTEEQLQKPNKNYGVLIDETLTAAGPDGLTLKQIYKRICQRYPWFYFHTETKGWESSVRHNLIGNEAFKKDETTNLWSRVPGVELDAGKKRKATSPDRGLAAAQGYGPYSYPYNAAAQHMAPGAPPGYPPGQAPPPGYQVPGYNGQPSHAARPVQYGASASPPGQPVQPVGAPPPAPIQLPGYGPPAAPARPQVGVPQPSAYSSPYASRPPPLATPPVKAEDGSVPPPTGVPGQQPPPPVAAATAAKTIPGAPPVPQPASVQAANRPSQTPPASAPARPVIDPRLLTAVVGLKNGLVENLKKARNPKAEAIVMSALNRCIGLKKEATENDKMEAICIKGIRQVIDGFTKGKSPTPGNSASPSDTPPVFEAKVLASLNGFKDVSIKALKARLGEARAEAVTLSAIDRVIGLADASIVPKAAEGESTGNFEGVEQHLMKSIRQLLMGMNQKLQGNP